MSSPTQRSLKKLRDEGYTADVVERWIPFFGNKDKKGPNGVRKDLFGFIDIIAIREGETLAVQTTSAAHLSDHIHKIEDNENLPAVRKAGWTIHVHAWRKQKNGRYLCKVVDVS